MATDVQLLTEVQLVIWIAPQFDEVNRKPAQFVGTGPDPSPAFRQATITFPSADIASEVQSPA